MKKIVFIGGFDKLDLIQYVAIVLHNVGKKVLLVDATRMQKSRYITPAIDNTKKQYITTTQGVDLAVGFRDYAELIEHGSLTEESYDYMFLDVDSYKALHTFKLAEDDLVFLTTTFDIYSLKVGLRSIITISN